jgi:hypothetical protein
VLLLPLLKSRLVKTKILLIIINTRRLAVLIVIIISMELSMELIMEIIMENAVKK